MTVVFLGTPEFAVPSLKAIYESRHRILAVVSQPDRETDRKGNQKPTPVKAFALQCGLPVYQFNKVSAEGLDLIQSLEPDVMVTSAFGQMLSNDFLNIAPVYNVHASLLPRYRGSAPIQAAILNGDYKTGVTIMKTVYEMDAGDIVLQKETTIGVDESYPELHDRLSVLGAELIVSALDQTENKKICFVPQDSAKASYTKKITKTDGRINWAESAETIVRKIRAFHPWPSAYTECRGHNLKFGSGKCLNFGVMREILLTKIVYPGEILSTDGPLGLVVGCGRGAIQILSLQAPGKKLLSAAEFLRGFPLAVGSRFGDGDES